MCQAIKQGWQRNWADVGMPDERFGGRLPHGFAVEMAGKEGVVAKFCVLVKR